jgi:radical SAM superfamily enzyme YgiQ (UPF0313 family)
LKALLIYPECPDTFWSFKHALKFIRKKAAYPPLGLLTVAALLPKDWSLRLIDVNVRKLTEKDLQWADMAFISGMAIHRRSVYQIIAQCREAGLTLVAGGPLFSSEHENFEGIDHFVLNEAEITLPSFLADLKKGSPQPLYETSEFCNINQTPPPRWDLINFKNYASMSVQFSRGCPFNCDFCNVTALFGHRPRIKSTDQIIAELDALYQSGWRSQVFIVDDNFIGNKKFLKADLLPALIRWRKSKKGMPFNTEASIDLADHNELMEMMVEAGFDAVFVGIETPDEECLAECNKRQNKHRDLLSSVKAIQQKGLQVQGGFIVGFDSDTRSIFQRQIDFIQNSGIVTAMVGLLQAPAGTRLYERLKKEGRLLGHMSGDTDGTTNIVTRMNYDLLKKGYGYILSHIYSHKQYYRRVRTFLRDYKPPRVKAPLDIHRILAFFRSSLRLGVFGRERFQYWGTLFWTLFHRPRSLALVITLAIYRHHFYKTTNLHIH